MFGQPRLVVDAELADVQLGATLRAFIEPPQRQRQCGERAPHFQQIRS
jgi:hypothetical protein